MKRIVVTGPESSGTRLLAALLDTHPDTGPIIHRSQPHNGRWVRVDMFEAQAWVVITRDLEATAESQVRHGHAGSIEEARDRVHEAVGLLEAQTARKAADRRPVVWVGYERLCEDTAGVLAEVCEAVGLTPEVWDWSSVEVRPLDATEPMGSEAPALRLPPDDDDGGEDAAERDEEE